MTQNDIQVLIECVEASKESICIMEAYEDYDSVSVNCVNADKLVKALKEKMTPHPMKKKRKKMEREP